MQIFNETRDSQALTVANQKSIDYWPRNSDVWLLNLVRCHCLLTEIKLKLRFDRINFLLCLIFQEQRVNKKSREDV